MLEKKVKHVLEHFGKEVNDDFFQRNYIGISSTLSTYLILKRVPMFTIRVDRADSG